MDSDSTGSIESFFLKLQSSETSPRNLSQIFEDDLLPMQKESSNLRYQPGGQKPQKSQPAPPLTSREVSANGRSGAAAAEGKSRRWEVVFAKVVNVYNGYEALERMGLALTMLGDNEAATMILYKQKSKLKSNTKLHPNGSTIHLQDRYVQFYDNSRKHWSLRFVHQADEQEFIHIMTSNGWSLEQHNTASVSDMEQYTSYSETDGEQSTHRSEMTDGEPHSDLRSENEVKQRFLSSEIDVQQSTLRSESDAEQSILRSESNVEQQQQEDTEPVSDQSRMQFSVTSSEQRSEQAMQQRSEQHWSQQEMPQRSNESMQQRSQQNKELLSGQKRDLLSEQNRQLLSELKLHQQRNTEKHQVVLPPKPKPRSRNVATLPEDPLEREAAYRKCLRHHFRHQPCEHMSPAPDNISEADVIVTPMSKPIGSTSSSTPIDNHYSRTTAVVKMQSLETESTTSLLSKFLDTHMSEEDMAEMKMQSIMDAMQRVSDGHVHKFKDIPKTESRMTTSRPEDAEDRLLELEQTLLDTKKENRELRKELDRRNEELHNFQTSSLTLLEKLLNSNEDLAKKNTLLVDTLVGERNSTSAGSCENCVRSAEQISFLKRHISALEMALREPE